jgi:carbon monoxide dehydrogenase subunit G
MSLVTVSTRIAAPREDVWAMVMDPYRLGDWVTIHRKLVHADGGAPRVGYTMDQQIHLRGVSLEVHWKLVECDPCARAVWEGRGPGGGGGGREGSIP